MIIIFFLSLINEICNLLSDYYYRKFSFFNSLSNSYEKSKLILFRQIVKDSHFIVKLMFGVLNFIVVVLSS